MTAATAARPQWLGLHTRGMAVGLAAGLAAIAFAALLPDAVAYIYLGAQLAGVGWVYFGFGVADGRPSAVAIQVLSAGAFLTVGFLGAYHESTVLRGGRVPRAWRLGLAASQRPRTDPRAHVVPTLLRRRRRHHRPATARRLGALAR